LNIKAAGRFVPDRTEGRGVVAKILENLNSAIVAGLVLVAVVAVVGPIIAG